MTHAVPLMDAETVYGRVGDLFALVCLIGGVALGLKHLVAMRSARLSKQDPLEVLF